MGRCVTGSSKKLTLLARGSLNPMDVVHLHGHVRADLLRDSDRELIRRRRLVVVRDDDDVAGQVLTFDVLERDAVQWVGVRRIQHRLAGELEQQRSALVARDVQQHFVEIAAVAAADQRPPVTGEIIGKAVFRILYDGSPSTIENRVGAG